MAVKLAFNGLPRFEDSNGNALSGGLLYTYIAGSSTKQTTYQESTGSTPHDNPIVLNSRGEPSAPIWLTAGVSYKFVLAPATDSDPPSSPIWSVDNITGINDTTSAIDEWIASGHAPTYISATSFSVSGDQTAAYHKRRRLKSSNTGGTAYSTVTASSFAASITTVTVVNDPGGNTLDSGLSAVSLSIVKADNPSIDPDMVHRKGTAVASAATCDIWSIVGDFVHITGNTGPITSFGTAPYAGAERTVIFDSTPTITHNATTLQLPGGASIVAVAGDRAVVRADTTANMIVVEYIRGPATQAEQEAGASLVASVTPGRQHNHPSAPKVWVQYDSNGTLTSSYNVTSVTDNAAGNLSPVWATDFSSGAYCLLASGVAASAPSSATTWTVQTVSILAGGANIVSVRLSDFTQVDVSYVMAIGMGDQ